MKFNFLLKSPDEIKINEFIFNRILRHYALRIHVHYETARRAARTSKLVLTSTFMMIKFATKIISN